MKTYHPACIRQAFLQCPLHAHGGNIKNTVKSRLGNTLPGTDSKQFHFLVIEFDPEQLLTSFSLPKE